MCTRIPPSVPNIKEAYPIGKKAEVKDKDVKKESINQAQNPTIDQKDKLQSNPVQSDNLKDIQKFPDKPSMGMVGKPPKDAEINAGQKPKPEMGTKPNFPTGKPGVAPPGTKPTLGQKPDFPMGGKGNMGVEGTPPAGAPIYPGKKIID